eukprot:PhM_4_TR10438/c1_g1_i4/m.78115
MAARGHVLDQAEDIAVRVQVESICVRVRRAHEQDLRPRARARVLQREVHRGLRTGHEMPRTGHIRVADIVGVLKLHPRLFLVAEAHAVVGAFHALNGGGVRWHAHVEGNLVARSRGVVGLAEAVGGTARSGCNAADFALVVSSLRGEGVSGAGVRVTRGCILDDLDAGTNDCRLRADEVVVLVRESLRGVVHDERPPRLGLAVVDVVGVVSRGEGAGLEVVQPRRRRLDDAPVVRAGHTVAHVPLADDGEAYVCPCCRHARRRRDRPGHNARAWIPAKISTGSDALMVAVGHAARCGGGTRVVAPRCRGAARREHAGVDAVESLVVVAVVVVDTVPAARCRQWQRCAHVRGPLVAVCELVTARTELDATACRLRSGINPVIRRHHARRCLRGHALGHRLQPRAVELFVHVTVRNGARREVRAADETKLIATNCGVVRFGRAELPCCGGAVGLRGGAGGVVHLDDAPATG